MEFKVSLEAWHLANWEFITETQAVHKVFEMFNAAGETTAADSLSGYMLAGSTIPPFSDILYDIDCLFKVNRIGNGLDLVNELNFKASTAQDARTKIEKLSKLVTGGHVSIRDIFMAGAIKDNISDGAKIALVNTMACLDREHEQVRFTEFKAVFRQTFPPPSSDTFYGQNSNKDYNSKEYTRERRNNRSGSTSISFHINGPGKSVFLIDTRHSTAAWGNSLLLNWGAT